MGRETLGQRQEQRVSMPNTRSRSAPSHAHQTQPRRSPLAAAFLQVCLQVTSRSRREAQVCPPPTAPGTCCQISSRGGIQQVHGAEGRQSPGKESFPPCRGSGPTRLRWAICLRLSSPGLLGVQRNGLFRSELYADVTSELLCVKRERTVRR